MMGNPFEQTQNFQPNLGQQMQFNRDQNAQYGPMGTFSSPYAYGQTRQMPQPVQQPILQFTGKFIGDPSEIVVQDIPTDGRMAIFPSKDCSYIIAKAWNTSGNINTVRYIPDPAQFQQAPEPQPQQDLSDILARLDKLEASFAQPMTPKRTNKKEDANNA